MTNHKLTNWDGNPCRFSRVDMFTAQFSWWAYSISKTQTLRKKTIYFNQVVVIDMNDEGSWWFMMMTQPLAQLRGAPILYFDAPQKQKQIKW